MSIDNDPTCDSVGISQNNVGGLTSDPGQLNERLELLRNLSPILFDQRLATGFEAAGLVLVKSSGADDVLKVLLASLGHFKWAGILGKQLGSDLVHPLIRALCGQNCRHEELKRSFEIESTVGIGIVFFE